MDLIGLAADKVQPGGRFVVSSGPSACGTRYRPGEAVAPVRFSPSLGSPLPADVRRIRLPRGGLRVGRDGAWPDAGYLIVATR